MICPELGVAPLVDPGTDIEDERSTPVGSPSPDIDKSVPLSTSSGVEMELARVLLEVGVLPVMVTPILDLEVGSSMTPAEYPVPPIPELLVMVSVPLEVASPARPAAGGGGGVQLGTSPCWARYHLLVLLCRRFRLRRRRCCGPRLMSVLHLVWHLWTSICHGVFRRRWGRPRIPHLLPAPLTPRQMVEGQFVPGSVVTSPNGETDVAGATRACQICLGRAPLTFIRTFQLLVPLHG